MRLPTGYRMFGLSAAELEALLPVLIIAILVLGGAATLFVLSRDSTSE